MRCMRSVRNDIHIPSGWRQIGMTDVHGGQVWRPAGEEPDRAIYTRTQRKPVTKVSPHHKSPDQWHDLQSRYYDACTNDMRKKFVNSMGLDWIPLTTIGLGWAEELNAWSFPMYGSEDNPVVRGIRLRAASGKKFAVKGSRDGVFRWLNQLKDTVYVAEGPTDTAALLELGFDAIGRPSCTGGVDILVRLLTERNAVIVSDSDSPGRSGAKILADRLKGLAKSIKIIEPHRKDMREWLEHGATRDAVELLTRNATEYGNGSKQIQGCA